MRPPDPETATRTICKSIANGECEHDAGPYAYRQLQSCRFSHTIMDTVRLQDLVVSYAHQPRELLLEYVAGREVFGVASCNSQGWRMSLTERTLGDERLGEFPTTRTLVARDFSINVATKKLEDEIVAESMYLFTETETSPEEYQTMCCDNRDGLCPLGQSCPNDHTLVETMRVQRIVGNTHHKDPIVYLSIRYAIHGFWQVTLHTRIDHECEAWNAPPMFDTPIFAVEQSLDEALRRIEEEVALMDASHHDHITEFEADSEDSLNSRYQREEDITGLPAHAGEMEYPQDVVDNARPKQKDAVTQSSSLNVIPAADSASTDASIVTDGHPAGQMRDKQKAKVVKSDKSSKQRASVSADSGSLSSTDKQQRRARTKDTIKSDGAHTVVINATRTVDGINTPGSPKLTATPDALHSEASVFLSNLDADRSHAAKTKNGASNERKTTDAPTRTAAPKREDLVFPSNSSACTDEVPNDNVPRREVGSTRSRGIRAALCDIVVVMLVVACLVWASSAFGLCRVLICLFTGAVFVMAIVDDFERHLERT